jgi:hypothetical protein
VDAVRLVALAAAIETGTGLILMVRPSALVWLLLGADLSQDLTHTSKNHRAVVGLWKFASATGREHPS